MNLTKNKMNKIEDYNIDSEEETERACLFEFTGKGNYQIPKDPKDPIKYEPSPNQINPDISLSNQKSNVMSKENKKHITYFNRSTNIAPYFKQYKGSCYANAATSAYINTCARICGAKVPTYDECIEIADYNKGNGGDPKISIKLLEDRFHQGVLCQKISQTEKLEIKTILQLSLIVGFTTSKQGWNKLAQGKLLSKPKGKEDGWHGCLIEGYDFKEDCAIIKNSWGNEKDDNAKPRCLFRFSAFHEFFLYQVYFTLASIPENLPVYKSIINGPHQGALDGETIRYYEMDAKTARYETSYVCQRREGDKLATFEYIGFPIDEWIWIKLNRKMLTKNEKIYVF